VPTTLARRYSTRLRRSSWLGFALLAGLACG